MLIHAVAGPLPPHNDYAAGYYRPSSRVFVPLVTGCPTPAVAQREAEQLQLEAQARERAAQYTADAMSVDHRFRHPARGWYAGDE